MRTVTTTTLELAPGCTSRLYPGKPAKMLKRWPQAQGVPRGVNKAPIRLYALAAMSGMETALIAEHQPHFLLLCQGVPAKIVHGGRNI
jgi:hypothetical protein